MAETITIVRMRVGHAAYIGNALLLYEWGYMRWPGAESFQALGYEVEHVSMEDEAYWLSRGDRPPASLAALRRDYPDLAQP